MSYFDHPVFQILLDTLPFTQTADLRRLIKNNDVEGLFSATYDRNTASFDDRFIVELFRKVSDAPLGIDTSQVAIDHVKQIELDNINRSEKVVLLSNLLDTQPDHSVSKFIKLVQNQLKLILGDAPCAPQPRYTFGATTTLTANNTVMERAASADVSSNCYDWLVRTGEIYPVGHTYCAYPKEKGPQSLYALHPEVLNFNNSVKAATVPKTALTDRFIAKGNVVNLSYQVGVHDLMIAKFKEFGLDFVSAQSTHRELAREGSITGDLATIDLSSASDTIVRKTVELLFPPKWYELLDSLREPLITYPDGEVKELQMFATSGNGFNSAVQTAIFLAIALVCTKNVYNHKPRYISVYGDDIILPSDSFQDCIKALKLFGFIPNERKSFGTGSFRESCGGDFLNGTNVRGYNAKQLPKSTFEWFGFINGIRRVCHFNNGSRWRSDNYRRLWFRCILCVEEQHRLYGPSHYGDATISTENADLYRINKRGMIKILTPVGSKYKHFAELVSSVRLPGRITSRIVMDASLRGHGKTYIAERDERNKLIYANSSLSDISGLPFPDWVKDNSYAKAHFKFRYPRSIIVDNMALRYEPRWVPFSPYGLAPDGSDIVALFDHIMPNCDFSDSALRLRRYKRRQKAMQNLTDILTVIRDRKMQVSNTVMSEIDSFDFDF